MTSLVSSATWAIGSGSGVFSLSFDAGATANRVLHVFVVDSDVASAPAVTYNGVSLVQGAPARGSGFAGIQNVLLYELIAPASGSNTLSITYGVTTSTHAAFIASIDGVNQDCPWTVGLPSHAGSANGGVITTPFSADSSQTCLSLAFANTAASIAPVDGSLTVQTNTAVGVANRLGVATRQGAGAAIDGRWTLPGGTGAAWYEILYRPAGVALSAGWYALTANTFQESGANNTFVGDQNIEPIGTTSPQMTKISANNGITVAGIDGSGNLYTWGSDNGTGMLGDGTAHPVGTSEVAVPTAVSGVTTAIDIAVGQLTVFFAKADGTVWYFGRDITSVATNHTAATQVSGLSNIVRIMAGSGTLLALDNAGALWFVGDNSEGQAGNGAHAGTVSTPFNMLSSVVDFALSEFHCAAASGGSAYCWGSNTSACTGQGTSSGFTTTPTVVVGPSNVIQVAALDEPCTLALTSTNQVWQWGGGSSGEGGDGLFSGSYVPHQITMPAGPTYSQLVPNYRSFECYVLTSAQTVYGFGANPFGALGRNGFANVGTPRQLFASLLNSVTALYQSGDDGIYFLARPLKGRAYAYLVGV